MTQLDRIKWFRFAILVLGGGTVYKLANLKDAFYVPMQEYMNLSHTEIGTLLSSNAIIATALFILGGYLADRFDPKKLVPIGLICTGFLGLYLSTFPGYTGTLITFCLLAVTADCIYWPSLLKAIRNLGDSNEQGRMFGFFEGGRGIIDTIVAFSALGVFVAMGSGMSGFKGAIIFYASCDIAAGVLSWFLLSNNTQTSAPAAKAPAGKGLLLEAMRNPQIWLVSLTVFMVYVVYCGLTYFIPYLKDVYGLPVALVGAYGIINQYFLKVLGGPLGGYMADKVLGSASRTLKLAFLTLLPLMAMIFILPKGADYVYIGMAGTLSFGLIIFSMRGIFWAPMSEINIPDHITGSAFGLACLVGYAPGMFAYMVYGSILDQFPGQQGYNYVFSLMAILALLGFIVANTLHRSILKTQKTVKNQA